MKTVYQIEFAAGAEYNASVEYADFGSRPVRLFRLYMMPDQLDALAKEVAEAQEMARKVQRS